MIVEKQKARATLLGRRKRAIIIFSLTFIVLLATAITVNHFVRFVPFEDVDGTEYRVVLKAGKYGLYDTNGNKLEAADEYSYFVTKAGTLVDVNADTGKTQIIAQVDTEYGEANDDRNQLLLFPKIGRKELSSLEVSNSHGKFKFLRYNLETDKPDNSSDFIIESAPLASYDQELFAELYVNAGYTISRLKIEDPIKDENGEFSEYGLVAEKRIDEEGNEYNYEPAYYVITDINGKSHKIIIGDMLVTGGGYYVQYVEMTATGEQKRDAVYVFEASIGKTLLASVETFVKPQIVYQMSVNDYLDVEEFTIFKYDDDRTTPNKVVGFTFIPLSERQGSITANKPYVFDDPALRGYAPHVDNISTTLSGFYTTSFEQVCKLAPEDEDFVKYGLGKIETVVGEDGKITEEFSHTPKYVISFYYDVLDENEKYQQTLKQIVYVSEPNEAGNYYAFSFVYEGHPDSKNKEKDEKFLYTYDMITEISAHCFDFLSWKPSKWVSSSYIDNNIAFIDTIDIKAGDYETFLDLDNSKTEQDGENVSSSLLTVKAKDNQGHDFETFSKLVVTDKSGFVWTITPTSIDVVNKKGEKSTISTAYYAYNKLGRQTKCVSGYIDCNDGRKVKVTADTVEVTEIDGSVHEYVRFSTTLFRQFYQTLLVATIVDTYELTEEEEAELLANKDKLIMSMTVKDTDGVVKELGFYKLTSRKAYITINGEGGYYVMVDRVEKIISDVQKFFNNIPIDAMSKK